MENGRRGTEDAGRKTPRAGDADDRHRAGGRIEAQPLARRHMPTDYTISLASYTGRGTPDEKRIPDDFGPRQPMRGFEETYRNIIDYIVRITYRIWEDREVEYIAATYADDSHVYDDYGLQAGSGKIIEDTRHTTGAFSNIALVADEIVWAGDDEVGFHTSHRTLIRGTNDGDGKYGPATNRDVDVLVIANCVSLENRIFLEHVCYNTSGLLLQLGLDPEETAARLAAAEKPAGWPRDEKTWRGLIGAARPALPLSVGEPIAGFDVDRFVRTGIDAAWNRRDSAAHAAWCTPDFVCRGPSNRVLSGTPAYAGFVDSLIGAFPDLEVQVDEVYWMGNEREGYLSAARWSAAGSHRGAGRYGPPTGAPVQIWGITQHEITGGRIAREWLLFNELDLMMQIAAARG